MADPKAFVRSGGISSLPIVASSFRDSWANLRWHAELHVLRGQHLGQSAIQHFQPCPRFVGLF